MLKLIPDFSGGFWVVEDYFGDFAGSIGLAAIAAFFIGAPIVLFLSAPESFSLAMACLGICLMLILLGNTVLSFLIPLALPIFSYGLASTCNTLLANTHGEMQVFMYLIIAVIILVGNAVVWTIAGGEVMGGASLAASVIMWISCCGSTMEGNDGTWNFYLLKFLWIAAAICCLVSLIQLVISFFKGKGPSLLSNSISLAAGAGVGLVLLFAAAWLGRFIHNWSSALVCLLIAAALYIAACAILSVVLPSGFAAFSGMIIVLLGAVTAWMIQNSSFNVPDIIIPDMLTMLKTNPVNVLAASLASTLPAYTSYLLSSLLTGLLDMAARFFDANNTILVTCSQALAINISLALLSCAAWVGFTIRKKVKKSLG